MCRRQSTANIHGAGIIARPFLKEEYAMDLEQWIIKLLDSIKVASDLDANFDLHLSIDDVKELASAYDATKWIEIY